MIWCHFKEFFEIQETTKRRFVEIAEFSWITLRLSNLEVRHTKMKYMFCVRWFLVIVGLNSVHDVNYGNVRYLFYHRFYSWHSFSDHKGWLYLCIVDWLVLKIRIIWIQTHPFTIDWKWVTQVWIHQET